jgi:penicillin amidase
MIDCESLVENDILYLYNAYRRNLRFEPADIQVVAARNDAGDFEQLATVLDQEADLIQRFDLDDIGSNNWVVSGDLTQDGWPMMINDPHRAQSVPS